MKKIVFIGAGSIIFVKNLIGDCMLTPSLCDSEFALLDINREKLYLAEGMLTPSLCDSEFARWLS